MRIKYSTAAVLAAATLFFCVNSAGSAHADPAPKALKCLAEAIYFEARSESPRGQMMVGQVILNRVASSRYPDTVCGVVYQNSKWRNRCQFSFACDGRPEEVTEEKAWEKAMKRSKALLACDEACRDEKGWRDGLWASTHYHTVQVQPSWAGKLRNSGKIGAHLFYVERRGSERRVSS